MHRMGWMAALAAAIVVIASSFAAGEAERSNARQKAERIRQPHPIRMTMKELHEQGGVPRRWKFLMPPGDPAEGRRVFVAMECFACHTVEGEAFPDHTRIARGPAPDLTGMGSEHPAEYFAESIIHPNRVIVLGPGYTGWDSFSKMPAYAELMTVKQLIDIVAYLKSLEAVDPPATHDNPSRRGQHSGHQK